MIRRKGKSRESGRRRILAGLLLGMIFVLSGILSPGVGAFPGGASGLDQSREVPGQKTGIQTARGEQRTAGVYAYQSYPLDEIQRYDIRLDMNEDGSVRIRYDLKWKVLNDSSEGPLTWVKVGIGNEHAKDFEAMSGNIKSVKYMRDHGGDYARIDLDGKYDAGEVVDFSFELTQYNIFQKDPDNQKVVYTFTPGWFDDTPIDEMNIYWGIDKVRQTDGFLRSDDRQEAKTVTLDGRQYYHAGRTDLDQGERMTVSVSYDLDAYGFVDGSRIRPNGKFYIYLALIMLGGPVFIFVLLRFLGRGQALEDTYSTNAGAARGYFHGRGSGGGGSCACACACAGGGRAGCSRKDFYGTKVSTLKLRAALREVARAESDSSGVHSADHR